MISRKCAGAILGASLLVVPLVALQAGVKPETVPTFKLRARALSLGGEAPTDKTFKFSVQGLKGGVASKGVEWSEALVFDAAAAAAAVKRYPNNYMRGWPLVVKLSVNPVVEPTKVEAEVKFDEGGKAFVARGELYGRSLGVLVWREADEQPRAASMAAYNQRYWEHLKDAAVPVEQRPKKFPIIDRFIGGDNDLVAWREGIENLARAGFSAIMLPPNARMREWLLGVGHRRTSWAIYAPLGYAFDYSPKVNPEAIDKWAQKLAAPFSKAGYEMTDVAAYAMSDEPGWYYPKIFAAMEKSEDGLARFHQYLRDRGFTPADLGAADWQAVKPRSRNGAKDGPSRRLFYWSMRFFSWDSARHFANCTKAMEKAFYPGIPIYTNWNFFSGRFYVPGPVANNRAKTDPAAAMGGHDWFEFGRMRGCTMLWTEDWFGDERAYQWSFYAAKLRCAAAKGGVEFGGYVIPRRAGSREDGILQKILCLVGSGGKAVKYFVFGPEYSFPGNCYSFKARLLPKMAEAHQMIGAAEEVLWPGRRPQPQVAILMPRSAQAWDAKDIAVPTQIYDATNVDPGRATVDYMAEVYSLYLALQHANIPVDFVDEDDLESPEALAPYRVLYVTEPNIPVAGISGLVRWTKAGGTLATVTMAGASNRYDEPIEGLGAALGIAEETRPRLLIKHVRKLEKVDAIGAVEVIGLRGKGTTSPGKVAATFDSDSSPAVIEARAGKGRVVHFAWMPGISYAASSRETRDKLPVGHSAAIRELILRPVKLAEVTVPATVDRGMIETPLLLSDAGAAVTLLNWSGEAQPKVELTVRLPFPVARATSVKQGKLTFKKTADGVALAVPLGAADIVMLRPPSASDSIP